MDGILLKCYKLGEKGMISVKFWLLGINGPILITNKYGQVCPKEAQYK